MASLEGSHKVSFNATDNGSVTGRLGAAAAQENDRHINSESDRQQLLIRWDEFSFGAGGSQELGWRGRSNLPN